MATDPKLLKHSQHFIQRQKVCSKHGYQNEVETMNWKT
jgi:hypothetical protein